MTQTTLEDLQNNLAHELGSRCDENLNMNFDEVWPFVMEAMLVAWEHHGK